MLQLLLIPKFYQKGFDVLSSLNLHLLGSQIIMFSILKCMFLFHSVNEENETVARLYEHFFSLSEFQKVVPDTICCFPT